MHIFCPDKHKISWQDIFTPGCSSIIGVNQTHSPSTFKSFWLSFRAHYCPESLSRRLSLPRIFLNRDLWTETNFKAFEMRSNMLLLTDKFKTHPFNIYKFYWDELFCKIVTIVGTGRKTTRDSRRDIQYWFGNRPISWKKTARWESNIPGFERFWRNETCCTFSMAISGKDIIVLYRYYEPPWKFRELT